MLSAILQKVTGETLLDYLRPAAFRAARRDRGDLGGVARGDHRRRLGAEPQHGVAGAVRPAAAAARQWEGKQLVPADWVDAATASRCRTTPRRTRTGSRGYGFQFWRAGTTPIAPTARSASTAWSSPSQDAHAHHHQRHPRHAGHSRPVWDHLLPASKADGSRGLRARSAWSSLPPSGAVPTGGTDGPTITSGTSRCSQQSGWMRMGPAPSASPTRRGSQGSSASRWLEASDRAGRLVELTTSSPTAVADGHQRVR